MRTDSLAQGCQVVLVNVIFILSLVLKATNGAPVGSETYIIHTMKNTTHHDEMAKHAWYLELMEGAKHVLAEGRPDDGMQCLHHVYHHVFDGFSASLTLEQAEYMRALPCVRSLHRDRVHKPDTTRSPEFVGLAGGSNNFLWPKSNYGDGVIIGVIDTGIWPESVSFDDTGLESVDTKKWKGICQEGERFTISNCNNKIIGARYISEGFDKAHPGEIEEAGDYRSARDFDGHGTHTAATAAGRWASDASFEGAARGVARGMAPNARIAVYKVLWETKEGDNSGMESDIMKGIDFAVGDGVDIISFSISEDFNEDGSILDFFEDLTVRAAYNAVKRGVFFSTSAGNIGPQPGTVNKVAPWYTTVAATTQDREVQQNVVLGNGETLVGRAGNFSANLLQATNASLIYAGHAAINTDLAENASFCQADTLETSLVAGKLLVCLEDDSGIHSPRITGLNVVGVIFANVLALGEELSVSNRRYINTQVGYNANLRIMDYLSSTETPTATILPVNTVYGVKPAPKVYGFSSRGPIRYGRGQWLKPDIAAPGVDILAAGIDGDRSFVFMTGTSMACPHVSGYAALIRSIHLNWSPAAIRSALMTTATTLDNTNHNITAAESSTDATPFGYGAGFARPEKAVDPGLVYDMGRNDYLLFLCGLKYTRDEIELIDADTGTDGFACPTNPPARIQDTNLPTFLADFEDSAALSNFGMSMKFNRTLTNVGESATVTYRASVDVSPPGFLVTIEPSTLQFSNASPNQTFVLTVAHVDTDTLPKGTRRYGSVSWTDGAHVVRSSVVVMVGF
ncbi:hypothetical protein KC19_2G049200 [Ceratodon purpureus]|uniref:Uncharacterized protein n=1 Tax=Ceratodon purpureus TaxID=3225 RepID=A0A8T0ISA1_CERPU|nr:hypothetical protein KC19_2G049200 [Ceratodon purpureus]